MLPRQGTTGLKWFKIAQDGLDASGKWGVDRMIAADGWQYFTMPICIPSGNYLMRVELIGDPFILAIWFGWLKV